MKPMYEQTADGKWHFLTPSERAERQKQGKIPVTINQRRSLKY